jgi:hypothetical protein
MKIDSYPTQRGVIKYPDLLTMQKLSCELELRFQYYYSLDFKTGNPEGETSSSDQCNA